MTLLKSAREVLGMTQDEFGVWMARCNGREAPYARDRVSKYENGLTTAPRGIRVACMRVMLSSKGIDSDAEGWV